MSDRSFYLNRIGAAISGRPTVESNRAAIEALLLTAATIANSMASQSVGFSSAHVEESATRMAEELEEVFGIEVLC